MKARQPSVICGTCGRFMQYRAEDLGKTVWCRNRDCVEFMVKYKTPEVELERAE